MFCQYCGKELKDGGSERFCSSCGKADPAGALAQEHKHTAHHRAPSGAVAADRSGPKAILIWCWSLFLAVSGFVVQIVLCDIPFSVKYVPAVLLWGIMLPALVGFGVILYIRHKQMTIPLEYSNATAVIVPVVIFALHFGGVIISSKLLALYWSAYIAVRMEGTVSFVNYIGLTCLWNWLLMLYFVMPFNPSASVKRKLAIGFTIWSVLLLLTPILLYGSRLYTMDICYFFLGWGPRLVRLWFTGLVVRHRMNPVVGAVFVLAVMGSQTLLSCLWIFGFMGFPSAGAFGADLAEFFAYMVGAVVLYMVRRRCL